MMSGDIEAQPSATKRPLADQARRGLPTGLLGASIIPLLGLLVVTPLGLGPAFFILSCAYDLPDVILCAGFPVVCLAALVIGWMLYAAGHRHAQLYTAGLPLAWVAVGLPLCWGLSLIFPAHLAESC